MILRRAKLAIRSVPILFPLLHAILKPFRPKGKEDERVRRYCSLLPELVSETVFVKVGANDGITGDPVSDIFLSDQRWKGLLIEPVPICFERLAVTFHDSARFALEQVAIGKSAGETTFYYVDQKAAQEIPDLPEWYDQLGSFDRNHIVKHLNGVLEPFIIERLVEVRTLQEVLEKNSIRNVHFLHIDTEGYDYEVLKTLNLADNPPWAIYIEHCHLCRDDKEGMLHLLRKFGYRVDDCGRDYFAIQRKSPLRRLSKDMAIIY
jgi:FkbM family methyltransferase